MSMDGGESTKVEQFVVGKIVTDVELDTTNGTFKWEYSNRNSKKTSTQVALSDIFGTEATDSLWTLHYIIKTKNKWLAKNVVFGGDSAVCKSWSDAVQDAVKAVSPNRPKRLLVFINPIGGKKTGVKDYHRIVAPLFVKAGVTTEVIVTEDGDHAHRILTDYDLSTIDGLVSVGGDGTFMRVNSALQHRLMIDAGKNINDPDVSLEEPTIPIGIIPTGTGQGMVRIFTEMKTIDIATAALHIIVGGKRKIPMLLLFNNNKFVNYCVMHACYGVYGDLIVSSETNRKLGRFRYLYAITKHMFKQRPFDMTVNIVPLSDEEKEWQSYSGRYIMVNVHLVKVLKEENRATNVNVEVGTPIVLTLDASAGRMGTVKHFGKFMSMSSEMYTVSGTNTHEALAVKFEVPPPEGSGNFQQCLNVDGEMIPVEQGEIYMKYLKDQALVYSLEKTDKSDQAQEMAASAPPPAENLTDST